MLDNSEANKKLDRIFATMMLKKIKEKIKERNWLNDDNWAVYITPGQKAQLRSEEEGVIFEKKKEQDFSSIDEVDVIVDPYIDDITVLPKDVQMMPSDLKLQDNPPLYLVKQMVNAEIKNPMLPEPQEKITIIDYFPYEVRRIVYIIDLDQVSGGRHCPEITTMLGKAVSEEPDWDFERRGPHWAFTKQFDVGDVIQEFKLTRCNLRESFRRRHIEGDIAESAVDLIGGSITQTLSVPVEKVVGKDTPPIPEDGTPLSTADWDTETKHVDVGEKRYDLGRMGVGAGP